jgi:hypothetical protein
MPGKNILYNPCPLFIEVKKPLVVFLPEIKV